MAHHLLEKHKSINPLNDDATTNAMLKLLVEAPRTSLASFFGDSANGGQFYLFENAAFPNKVIEYVPGTHGDDSVTTLYEGNEVFNSRKRLSDVRDDLVSAIDLLLMAVPGTTTVKDGGRERELFLRELGTAQLIDVLEHFSGSAKSGVILRV